MKITTLIRINDVLKSEGYKTVIVVQFYKELAFVKLHFNSKKQSIKETLYSKTYNHKYVLRKLDGIKFDSVKIKVRECK